MKNVLFYSILSDLSTLISSTNLDIKQNMQVYRCFFFIHFDSNLFGISSIFHSWSCKTNLPIQYFYGKCVTSTASKTCSINVWQDDKQRVCCWHFHYYFFESTKQCALVPFSPFFSIVAIFFYRLPSNERRKKLYYIF